MYTNNKDMEFEVSKTRTIDDQMIKDQIITALEGGSNYWYLLDDLSVLNPLPPVENECLSERIGRAVLDHGISIPVFDLEDSTEQLGVLSKENIQRGLKLMYEDYNDHYQDMIEECGDADTADVFLQLCVMGEIVFG